MYHIYATKMSNLIQHSLLLGLRGGELQQCRHPTRWAQDWDPNQTDAGLGQELVPAFAPNQSDNMQRGRSDYSVQDEGSYQGEKCGKTVPGTYQEKNKDLRTRTLSTKMITWNIHLVRSIRLRYVVK